MFELGWAIVRKDMQNKSVNYLNFILKLLPEVSQPLTDHYYTLIYCQNLYKYHITVLKVGAFNGVFSASKIFFKWTLMYD